MIPAGNGYEFGISHLPGSQILMIFLSSYKPNDCLQWRYMGIHLPSLFAAQPVLLERLLSLLFSHALLWTRGVILNCSCHISYPRTCLALTLNTLFFFWKVVTYYLMSEVKSKTHLKNMLKQYAFGLFPSNPLWDNWAVTNHLLFYSTTYVLVS